MVQPLHHRLGRLLDVAVIDQVTLGGIDIALDDHFEAKRMSMQSPAFVPIGKRRQIVGRLKVKCFRQSHAHLRRF